MKKTNLKYFKIEIKIESNVDHSEPTKEPTLSILVWKKWDPFGQPDLYGCFANSIIYNPK